MPRACMTDTKVEYLSLDLVRGHNESKSTVKKIGNTFYVDIEDHVVVTDTIHIGVGFSEKFQEKQIVEVFRKLQKMNSYGISKSYGIYGMNLNSSLSHYEKTMSEFSKLFKFKHLFNALEIAINIDGNDRIGNDLDTEAKRI